MAAIAMYGCGHKHEGHAHTHNHAGHDHTGHDHETAEHNEDEIIFTKAQAARTEFEVKEIQPSSFQQVIKTTGQILPAPGDETVIVAVSNGVVSYANRNLAAGSATRQGETLFYINSKNLNDGDYYTRVRANYEKSKTEYERAKELVKDKIVSQKELESARLDYENAKTAYEAIAGKQSGKGITVTAPMKGYIKNIAVKDGEYVTAGQTIATVSQNKRLMLQAEVSEKYYASLNNIRSANFKTPYDNHVYTLKELNGKLLSVGQSVEENTFFLPVTFEFDNQGTVIPGSFVEIYLLSSPLENVLSLPVSALTNEMGSFYVYKQLDEEGYQKQEVKTGRNNGNEVEIISGVQPGDRIVTKGAYQVKMASASGAIPGHTHEH